MSNERGWVGLRYSAGVLRKGGKFGRLVLLAVSGVLSLLVLEGLVRLTMPRFSPGRQLRLQLEANGTVLARPLSLGLQRHGDGGRDVELAINRHGFRDSKDLAEARPSDLFAVGDSFTLGWGVDEERRFSDLLEGSVGVPVYNLAIPVDVAGYERLVAHAQGRGAPVERLIIGLCLENDLRRYDATEDPTTGTGGGIRQTPEGVARASLLHRTKRVLDRHSAAYGALARTVHNLPLLRGLARRVGLLESPQQYLDHRTFDPEVIAGTADAVAGLVRRRGISETVVLLIPSRALWAGDNRAVEARIHEAMVAALTARGLPIVDPRPAFEATDAPLSLHFEGDWHWNEAGHRLAAELLHRHYATLSLPAESTP